MVRGEGKVMLSSWQLVVEKIDYSFTRAKISATSKSATIPESFSIIKIYSAPWGQKLFCCDSY